MPAAASSLLNFIIMKSTYIGEKLCTKSELVLKFLIYYTSDCYKQKMNVCIAQEIKTQVEARRKQAL